MSLQRTVPFSDGMALGLGLDDLTGEAGSLRAVSFAAAGAAEGEEGMDAHYDTSLVYSATQMYSALGVDVRAEGRYGLFSAEGKFRFAEESRFNARSTFLVARAEIANAFRRVEEPVPVEDAQQLVRDGKTALFRSRYGDLFIRGVKSGGEYIAVLSITAATESQQRELAIALKASFDGIAAGGSVDARVQSTVAELSERSETRVSIYQRGGSGEQISYTGTIDEVMHRLKTFATAVQEKPKAYSVQAASYDTLAFPPGPGPFDIQRQREVLEDCMEKRLALQTIRNDLEMVLEHPDYFRSPTSPGVLSGWSRAVTDELNALDHHVRKVAESISSVEFFPLTLPPELAIPERLQHSSEQVEVYSLPDFGRGAATPGVTPRSQVLPIGRYDNVDGQLTIGNDAIRSLKVPEGLGVRAYEHSWFQGATIDFTSDVSALGDDWNARISALVVYPLADGPPRITQIVGLDFVWSRWLTLGPGRYPDLAATSLGADTLSALLIPLGMTVRLWDGANFEGATIDYSSDTYALPPEWDNRAGSMEVTDLRPVP